MVAAVSAISADDTSGVALRAGMIMVTAGAALMLPWKAAVPSSIACWFIANLGRTIVADWSLFNHKMMLELPGLVGLAIFSVAIRHAIAMLEADSRVVGAGGDSYFGIEEETGVFEERFLRPAIEAELSRSRRFQRQFAVVLVGIDQLRQRFDYRSEEEWDAGFLATAELLRRTRNNIDRVYRYGNASFALVLPESGPGETTGMVRRLRRLAKSSQPREGEPGGPLPASFGATFFPTCATTVEDLLRRAEIALRLAERNSQHLQLDGAEVPAEPAPETLRRDPRPEDESDTLQTLMAATSSSNGTAALDADGDIEHLLQRFNETRLLLHRLRTGETTEKAS